MENEQFGVVNLGQGKASQSALVITCHSPLAKSYNNRLDCFYSMAYTQDLVCDWSVSTIIFIIQVFGYKLLKTKLSSCANDGMLF